ncbi:hypothetical protein [Paraburkholderia bannensis]|uniref:hypothetical protein n=1 Tax=Paraburkholderia bannensis TaxID=765414 RepID=UPI002AAF8B00|nr:hypothetical protein [Paraburkholderia bannensis]
MWLTDDEIARIRAFEPFLLNEARAALHNAPRYDLSLELATDLEPGLRIRAPRAPPQGDTPAEPPFPLNLYVALPADELRALTMLDDASRAAAIAHFGKILVSRLRHAIQSQLAHEVDLYAGVQGESGTLTVTLGEV